MNKAKKRLDAMIGAEGLRSTAGLPDLLALRVRIGWAAYLALCSVVYQISTLLVNG